MSSRAMRLINRMADLVRREGEITIYDMCVRLGIAPSTAFQYAKVVSAMFEDIEYDHGTFRSVDVE